MAGDIEPSLNIKTKEERQELREKVVNYLTEYGILKGNKLIKHIKSTHGSCCTCQDCGYHYDDCVCEHNEVLLNLIDIFN